jgi:YVTN family beta-propeller protein
MTAINSGSGPVTMIDVASLKAQKSVPVGRLPCRIAAVIP